MVSVNNKTTIRTRMNSVRECLLNKFSTVRALLACVAWVNKYDASTSPFCLVRSTTHKLRPSYIAYTFTNRFEGFVLHLVNVKFLKNNSLIFIHKSAREFMCKITTFIGNLLVDTCHNFAFLCSFYGKVRCFRKLSLCLNQSMLICLEEPWIGNLFSSGERGERLQPYVNTKDRIGCGKWLGLFNFTNNNCIPLVCGSSTNSTGFGNAINSLMMFEFYRTYFVKFKPVVNNYKSILVLWIRYAIVSILAAKTRIARLVTIFNSPKKFLKRIINSFLCVVETVCIGIRYGWIALSPFADKTTSVIKSQRFFSFFPRLFSDLKCFIVYPSTSIEGCFQCLDLFGSGINSVFERLFRGNSPLISKIIHKLRVVNTLQTQ